MKPLAIVIAALVLLALSATPAVAADCGNYGFTRGDTGSEPIFTQKEIVGAGAGGGMTLVAPGDVPAIAAAIDALLSDGAALRAAGEQARATVQRAFSWSACGAATVARSAQR